jgi:hypothetical protein
MNNNEVVLSKFVVNKVWEVAQSCVDETRKGWFVNMEQFHDAMDGWDFTAEKVRAALEFLESRTYVLPFKDEDGHVTRISLVPQRYQCGHCNMWLDMQRDPEDHIDSCLKRQAKIERNRKLLR